GRRCDDAAAAGLGGNPQMLAGLQAAPSTDAVGPLQRCLADAVAVGDAGERLTATDLVLAGSARDDRGPNRLPVGGEGDLELFAGALWQADPISLRRDDAAIEGRIQISDGLLVGATELGDRLERDGTRHLDGLEPGRRRRRDVESVLLGRFGHLDGGE